MTDKALVPVPQSGSDLMEILQCTEYATDEKTLHTSAMQAMHEDLETNLAADNTILKTIEGHSVEPEATNDGDANALFDALKQHLSIHTVQQITRESNLPSARSWTALKGIITTGLNNNPELANVLYNAMQMQLCCDLKATSYFPLEINLAKEFAERIQALPIPDSDMSLAFPIPVSDLDLKKDDGQLKIIAKIMDEHGLGLVFSRRRSFTESREISRAAFTDELTRQFPDAEKIIEVKSYNRQTFDVIYLNTKATWLEVRADITREGGDIQTSHQLNKSISDLKTLTGNLVSSWKAGYCLDKPINLMPLAKEVYKDLTGAIKKLGFATETESVKRETMKAGVDLRSELFHKAGAEAIDHKMAIFEVAIQWDRKKIDGTDSKPELHIPGTAREYAKMNARTDYIITKGIRTHNDANFILSKIKEYKK